MTIYALGDRVPKGHEDAYVHPDAVVDRVRRGQFDDAVELYETNGKRYRADLRRLD